MNAFLRKFMMYYEIKRMSGLGRSVSQISLTLGCNRRTVKKYLEMDDKEFEAFMAHRSLRQKVLLPYEDFVRGRLEQFQDTSAAQMHDWLKEAHDDFPKVDPKTIFNFVKWVRQRHDLPQDSSRRDYQIIPETPYGLQAQVDFGEYNLRQSNGKRIKVFFFTLVLSRSRFKFVWFSDRPFTTELAIQGHEKAFGYIGGIPSEIVYDQDRVFISNENSGDIILTERFRDYVREQGFGLHFCRKSDPESKGKIENVVGYVKRNFLYNRTFEDLQTLNLQAIKWLERTANAMQHGATKQVPQDELVIERPFLARFDPLPPTIGSQKLHSVRKDNTVSWKSNLYSLPLGTYKGRGTQVSVKEEGNRLIITEANGTLLCAHPLCMERGKKVVDRSHQRDRHVGLEALVAEICEFSAQSSQGLSAFITTIRKDKPRYLRDQLLLLRQTIRDAEEQVVVESLKICLEQGINSANDFKTLVSRQKALVSVTASYPAMNPLNGSLPHQALLQPQTSSIDDYKHFFTKPDKPPYEPATTD